MSRVISLRILSFTASFKVRKIIVEGIVISNILHIITVYGWGLQRLPLFHPPGDPEHSRQMCDKAGVANEGLCAFIAMWVADR